MAQLDGVTFLFSTNQKLRKIYTQRTDDGQKSEVALAENMILEQDLWNLCLICWIGYHPRDSDSPPTEDHSSRVVSIKGSVVAVRMVTSLG